MREVDEEITVNAPLPNVYDQWTQFEDFPRFMKGVERVEQIDDTTLEWTAKIGGKEKSWRAKITEQRPKERILWKSTTGAETDGRLEFEEVNGDETRVRLFLRYDPEGVTENLGDVLGIVDQRVKGDLKRFKEFVEERGEPTGKWRGEVEAGQRVR